MQFVPLVCVYTFLTFKICELFTKSVEKPVVWWKFLTVFVFANEKYIHFHWQILFFILNKCSCLIEFLFALLPHDQIIALLFQLECAVSRIFRKVLACPKETHMTDLLPRLQIQFTILSCNCKWILNQRPAFI